jgi:DUF4097 and DUF4098 domain-containing protein YvlB
MNQRHEEYQVGSRPRLAIRLASGGVRVLPGPDGTIDVTVRGSKPDQLIIEQVGDQVAIRQDTGRWSGGSLDISITAPEGVDIEASLASTDLTVEVGVTDLQVNVASGDVRTRRVLRDASVKSASGDVEIDEVAGKLRITSASGDVSVGVVGGDAGCSTASGDITLGVVTGDVATKSASGDVDIDDFRGGELRGKTVSGDMKVGLRKGVQVDVDLQTLSGRIHLPSHASPAEAQDRAAVRISFKSVSGNFELTETVVGT